MKRLRQKTRKGIYAALVLLPLGAAAVATQGTAGMVKAPSRGDLVGTTFSTGGDWCLPSWFGSPESPYRADTWVVYGSEYEPCTMAPPADAAGHQWYDYDYELTNNPDDQLPDGTPIVWENHQSPFGSRGEGGYDYLPDRDTPANIYIRRTFTIDDPTFKPKDMLLSFTVDDSPSACYLNGTLIYDDPYEISYGIEHHIEMTPEQIALLHTDGTPNILAAYASQGYGDYHIDCGLYESSLNYYIFNENECQLQRSPLAAGEIVIPEIVSYGGYDFTVTSIDWDAFRDIPVSRIDLPRTVGGANWDTFWGAGDVDIRAYFTLIGNGILWCASQDCTEIEVPTNVHTVHNSAFAGCKNLRTVTLPLNLEQLKSHAFEDCKSLTDIYYYAPEAVEIDQNVFEGVDRSKVTIHIYESAAESFRSRWGNDFVYDIKVDPKPVDLDITVNDRGTLSEVILTEAEALGGTTFTVQSIKVTGEINEDDLRYLGAFTREPYALARIDLSDTHIDGNIPWGCFEHSPILAEIQLPEDLGYIDCYAFANCDALTAIHIPDSVKRLGEHAFYNCDKLSTVTGCQGITEANLDACEGYFFECASLDTPLYSETIFLYLPQSWVGDYQVPETIRYTAGDCMRGCTGLTSVTIPAGVLELGNDTFRDCHGLTDVTCYAPVPPRDHDFSFYGVDMSHVVAHVPEFALDDYRQASEWCEYSAVVPILVGELYDLAVTVDAPSTLDLDLVTAAAEVAGIPATNIGKLIISGDIDDTDIANLLTFNTSLYYLTVIDLSATTLEAIGDEQMMDAPYKEIVLPSTLQSIGWAAFHRSRLTSVTIPATVKEIGESAFNECYALATVDFAPGSQLEIIHPNAFRYTAIRSLKIPDSVTELGHRALQDCHQLTSIDFGRGVTYVPECFAEFSGRLSEVVFRGPIQSIGWRVFYGPSLTDITFYGKRSPGIDGDAFYDGHNPETRVHVYENLANKYANVVPDFTIVGDLGICPMPSIEVAVNGEGEFENSLQEVLLEEGIESALDVYSLKVTGILGHCDLEPIANMARQGMLAHLDMSGCALYRDGESHWLPEGTFAQSGLCSVSLPYNLPGIDWNAFEWCRDLTEVTLNDNLWGMRSGAFRGSGLTSIVIPDNVVNIESDVFAQCSNLRSIVFGKGLSAINDCVCFDCDNLEQITITADRAHINEQAFCSDRLTDIWCYGRTVVVARDNSFYGKRSKATKVHVPSDLAEKYASAPVWNDFTVVGDLPAVLPKPLHLTVNVPQPGMFPSMLRSAMNQAGCTDANLITSLSIVGYLSDSDIRSISDMSRGDGQLMDLDMGRAEVDGSRIYEAAFRDTYLRSVVMPSNLKWLEYEAFCYSGLESVDFNDAPLENSGWDAFWSTLLTEVVLPNTVRQIESGTFAHCNHLRSLTILSSPEYVNFNAMLDNPSLTDIYFYGVSVPEVGTRDAIDCAKITLHVYEELVEPMEANEDWCRFNIVGDLGSIGSFGEMAVNEYKSLCKLNDALGGDNWRRQWITSANNMIQASWTGVTFTDGHVTSIRLNKNGLSGDITALTLDLPYLTTLEMYDNDITGDPSALAASLPALTTLNIGANRLSTVDGKIPATVTDLCITGQYYGSIGESTLTQALTHKGLPNIYYYDHAAQDFSTRLLPGTSVAYTVLDEWGNERWDWRAEVGADGEMHSWGVFDSDQGATIRVKDTQTWATNFDFTYTYRTADATMDDAVNVLDLQATLLYSHLYDGHGWEGVPFNVRAADTHADGVINVQDIVTTVNTLLGITPQAAPLRKAGAPQHADATICLTDGMLSLNSTREVSAIDICINGVRADEVTWLPGVAGFSVAVKDTDRGVHAIIYSMDGDVLPAGSITLAAIDNAAADVQAVTLADASARAISVAKATTSAITGLDADITGEWTLTDATGRVVLTGEGGTAAQITARARANSLRGVLILSHGQTAEKLVIK